MCSKRIEGNIDESRVRAFLKSAGADTISDLCGAADVYHATVSKGDVFFLPHGFLIGERVATNSDVFGVVASMVVRPTARAVKKFKDVADEFAKMEATSCEVDELLRLLETSVRPEELAALADGHTDGEEKDKEGEKPGEQVKDKDKEEGKDKEGGDKGNKSGNEAKNDKEYDDDTPENSGEK